MSFYSCNLGLRKVLKNSGSQGLRASGLPGLIKNHCILLILNIKKTMEVDFLAPNSLGTSWVA